MAKSWKTLIKTTDSESQGDFGNNSSFNKIQLTLDEIAAQDEVLDNLLKERKSLENGLDSLINPSNSDIEDKRFAGSIESLKDKREKEKNRIAQKKKLEERLLQKNKELEKWEQNLKRLKDKLALQKKSLLKKETKQDSSTSLKAPKSRNKSSEKNWFDTTKIRKKKDEIERKKKVLTEGLKKIEKSPEKIRDIKSKLDSFGLKDLAKFQQKLDPVKETADIPKKIRRIGDDWNEKREIQKEKLREKVGFKKLSEKLEEAKRFGQSTKSEIKNSLESMESKVPEIKEMTNNLEKELSLDDRQSKVSENASAKKSEQKEAEKKDTERKEKLKERLLSIRKAERKEEERSSKKKERKNEKYN
jgi:hypothetical protein